MLVFFMEEILTLCCPQYAFAFEHSNHEKNVSHTGQTE